MGEPATESAGYQRIPTDEEQDMALAMVVLQAKADLIARWSWRKDAECQNEDPGLFVLDSGTNAARGKKICLLCPVREKCYDFAVKYKCMGLWGGVMFTVNSTPSSPASPPVTIVPLTIIQDGRPVSVIDQDTQDLFS